MEVTPLLKLNQIEAVVEKRWTPIARRLDQFLGISVSSPPETPCTRPGFWVWSAAKQTWQLLDELDSLDSVVVLDFEAEQVAPDVWRPTCCSIYGALTNTWFYWISDGQQEVMPFPPRRIVIGHKSGSYDRRYLSAEYDYMDSQIIHIDTMQLATVIQGVSEDKGSANSGNALLLKWKMFDARSREGKGVPVWYEKCGPVNLKFLAMRYLGIDLDKSVRDSLIDEPTTVSADTLYAYCSNDTYITALLAQKLLPIARQYIPSPISWFGMARVNSSKYYLRDWGGFIDESAQQYADAQEKLAIFQQKLIDHALAAGRLEFPDLDWKIYVRGVYKGFPHWVKNVRETDPMSGNASAYLLNLFWNDKKVILYKPKKGEGTVPKWRTEDGPLPHPDGGAKNLGTPLCADYMGFARSGLLRSEVVPQDTLIKLFELLDSCTQWVSYQSRYRNIYRRKTGEYELSVEDLNGTGTISRRSTGLWVVLPKPKKTKIGSGVMRHIVPPEGYDLVTADFVSQESRIACAVFADARAGKHFSTEWTRAIMVGKKSDKTDAHNLTAARFDIDRHHAKTINFLLQYGGGLVKLVNALILLKGISREAAEQLCVQFMHWYKGKDGGVATPVFDALKAAAHKEHGETYLLRVRQPNSINPKFLFDQSAFHTLRTNWPIQSAGVDEKHCLIALIEYYADLAGIRNKIQYALDVHDREGFFAHKSISHLMPEIFNKAMDNLIHISYEAAARYWERIDGKPRPVLEPLENWRQFEVVNISDTLVED